MTAPRRRKIRNGTRHRPGWRTGHGRSDKGAPLHLLTHGGPDDLLPDYSEIRRRELCIERRLHIRWAMLPSPTVRGFHGLARRDPQSRVADCPDPSDRQSVTSPTSGSLTVARISSTSTLCLSKLIVNESPPTKSTPMISRPREHAVANTRQNEQPGHDERRLGPAHEVNFRPFDHRQNAASW